MAQAERSDRDRYLRLLMWLLVPAAFFNGFDGELRALLLPQLEQTFHVRVAELGLANIPIGAGQFAAFFVIRLADRVGRRPFLLVSLVGYACCTALSAAAFNLWSFAAFQSLSQLFLGAEYALAALVVLEEFPPERRGRALGRLLIAGPAGVVATGMLLAAGLGGTSLGWRAFYLVGLAPALALGAARRLVRETRVFEESGANRRAQSSLRAVLAPPWRRPLLALGAISLLEKIPATAGAGWWVFYAEREQHLPTSLVSLDLAAAFALGSSGYYVCGRLIDRFGRRPVATAYLVGGCGFGVALFQSSSEAGNFAFLVLAVFFGLGIGPALSALANESFPTPLRAQGAALIGNGFANTGELAGPALVGILGGAGGALGSIGTAVSALAVLMLVAIPILWCCVAETRGAALDERVGRAARDRDGPVGQPAFGSTAAGAEAR